MRILNMCITGGSIVTPNGLMPRSIGIHEGRIAAILKADETLDADEHIDVTGKLLMPGMIDAHVHFREPGLEYKEGFEAGSRAAVAGGVTTVMVMPTDNPVTFTAADFETKANLAAGKSYADFALQAAIGEDLSHVKDLAGLGAISFELFLADVNPSLMIQDTGHLRRALALVGAVDGVAGLYGQDDGMIAAATCALDEAARRHKMSFFRSHPHLADKGIVARPVRVVN